MYRYAQADLLDWFKSKGRKPLIVRGARQVGKSTLIRQFCHENKLDLFELNLEERPLKSLKKDGYPLDEVIAEIEFINKKKIVARTALIFIDEIQEQPKAINLLRYFQERKKEFAVISAGSLLEVVIQQEKIEIPVGRVDFYQLGPMTFKEFLLAAKETELLEYLTKIKSKKIPDFIHSSLIDKLKIFYIIGGMPEVMDTYLKTKSFVEAQRVQYRLLEAYKNDFNKYISQHKIPRMDLIFDYVPTHLGKKVKYVEIARDYRAKDLKDAIGILSRAKIISPVCFTRGKKIPLKRESDSSIYKLFFLDVGLCSKINNISLETFDDELFSFYLKGELAEQYVFQHLFYGHGKFESSELFYWMNEKKNSAAELDFLCEFKNKIIPIEVKSTVSTRLKSLIYYMHLNKLDLAVKISLDVYKKEKIVTKIHNGHDDVSVSFIIVNLPLYLVEEFQYLI